MIAFGMEPEVVGYHFFQPHTAPALDCVAVGSGYHSHLFRPFSVAVDEGVIQDLGHGLHRLSVPVIEPTFAVGQRLFLRSEEHSGEAALHLPDALLFVLGYRHGHTAFVLEDDMAVIVALREVPGTEILDTQLDAVEESVFHGFAPFVGVVGSLIRC